MCFNNLLNRLLLRKDYNIPLGLVRLQQYQWGLRGILQKLNWNVSFPC